MRYIRKCVINEDTESVEGVILPVYELDEYMGYAMGSEWYVNNGYHAYNGTHPIAYLDIIDGYIENGVVKDGRVVERDIPEPVTPPEEIAKAERDKILTQIASKNIPIEDDATAYAVSPICPEWQPDTPYGVGEIVNYNGISYRVMVKIDKSLEHQYPGATGMAAVYRPIDPASGTKDDPKTFYYAMDVKSGLYYTYNGRLYLAKSDMNACVWYPGDAGVWQWELVE